MNTHTSIDVQAPILVDPTSLMENPHARFATLREEHPVVQLADRQYLALRGHDALSLLTDPRTVQVDGLNYVQLSGIPAGFVARLLTDTMLLSNGEPHRDKRSLFARSFAFASIKAGQSRIRAVADAIVAQLPRGKAFDLVEHMSARLPAEMIAAMLGLPAAEIPAFAKDANELAKALAPAYPIKDHERIEAAAANLFRYIEEHIHRRLSQPENDLLSAVASSWKADPTISFESLVHQVMTIIIGGTDTTRVAFATIVGLLAMHPEQWAALRDDQRLIPGAVAEGLRYEPVAASVPRFTLAPVGVGGVALPPGVMLRVSIMSAMRDPALYANPDVFDITRTDHPRLHPAFGLGPHRCIGEMLARLELQEGLAALASAVTRVEVDEPPRLTGFAGIRQIAPLRVLLH